MRFVFGDLPDDNTFNPDGDQSWTALKESENMWVIQLQAFPFLVANYMVIMTLFGLLKIEFELNILHMFLSFIIFIPIHELIHAAFFPSPIQSKDVSFGFNPKGLAFYAFYSGEMSRNRFIAVLLAPFVIISVIGLSLLYMVGSNSILGHIVVFNAIAACADCMGVFMLLRQVPSQAILRNKRIKTFWRLKNEGVSDVA